MVTILSILSSCDKSGNLGAEESVVWQKRTSVTDKMKYFKPRCLAYGFKENTDAMRQCLADEIRSSEKNTRDKYNRLLDRINNKD